MNFKTGDIVLITYSGKNPIGDFDISKGLASVQSDKNFYFDAVYHCNRVGYEKVADKIFEVIKPHLLTHIPFTSETVCVKFKSVSHSIPGLKDFISSTKEKIRIPLKNKKIGSIVMNCNPFTNGHLHLVEYAAKNCDFLIIFVVQEDRSFFPFKDRIELVRKGTEHLKNVAVVPSGAFIISTVTFPAYFTKDNPLQTDFDCMQDVFVFAKHIAPAFNISMRFVGEEPFDATTANYNKKMHEILPEYGINVIEIQRKERSQTGAISASTVRKLLNDGNFETMKELVPKATFKYLCEKWRKN